MNRSSNGFVLTVYISIIFFISSCESFYLPRVAPRDFQKGDLLPVKVTILSSPKTKLPYEYYFLNYCKPQQIHDTSGYLWEVLLGEHIQNSVYMFRMREEQLCKVGCRIKLDAESAQKFKEKIDDNYRVNMILDNVPVAVFGQRRDGSTTYKHGFRVGFKGYYAGSKDAKYFINNHLSFRVMYQKDPQTDSARIVGFEVTPTSIKHEYKGWGEMNRQLTMCNQNTEKIIQGNTKPQEVATGQEVMFTYDVTFKLEDDDGWAD
ncbi:hypothetical protein L1887_19859 [Cichorium endivia]|nr:hypothetical protein L1887_19859 [Cichorium endivia]